MREKGFDEHTYHIIGAAMEVHSVLGPGFMEAAYNRALCREFEARGIAFEREMEVPLVYKGESLGVPFRADFLCDDVILELKALPVTGPQEYRQLCHHVLGTGCRAGLLMNFGSPRLHVERFDLATPSSIPSILPSRVSHTHDSEHQDPPNAANTPA
ncbi:MAG: GxxExxY protein [Halobacteriales archaeon]|nr:GxxExxY protein [Halobacteriales archaeon]